MDSYHLSKHQVLTEFYYREIPLLLNRIKVKRQNEALIDLNNKLHSLHVAVATAGMCPNIEAVESLRKTLTDSINQLSPAGEEKQDPYEVLRNLQRTIAQARTKRR